MTNVLKKGGRKQAFSPAKLRRSVERAARDVKLAPRKAMELVKEVAEPVIDLARKKKLVRAVDLRKSLLGRLDRRQKSVANAWRRFDKKKKK